MWGVEEAEAPHGVVHSGSHCWENIKYPRDLIIPKEKEKILQHLLHVCHDIAKNKTLCSLPSKAQYRAYLR
jgi:hypothetical protein